MRPHLPSRGTSPITDTTITTDNDTATGDGHWPHPISPSAYYNTQNLHAFQRENYVDRYGDEPDVSATRVGPSQNISLITISPASFFLLRVLSSPPETRFLRSRFGDPASTSSPTSVSGSAFTSAPKVTLNSSSFTRAEPNTRVLVGVAGPDDPVIAAYLQASEKSVFGASEVQIAPDFESLRSGIINFPLAIALRREFDGWAGNLNGWTYRLFKTLLMYPADIGREAMVNPWSVMVQRASEFQIVFEKAWDAGSSLTVLIPRGVDEWLLVDCIKRASEANVVDSKDSDQGESGGVSVPLYSHDDVRPSTVTVIPNREDGIKSVRYTREERAGYTADMSMEAVEARPTGSVLTRQGGSFRKSSIVIDERPSRAISTVQYVSNELPPQRLNSSFQYNGTNQPLDRLNSSFQYPITDQQITRLNSSFQHSIAEGPVSRLNSSFQHSVTDQQLGRLNSSFQHTGLEERPSRLNSSFQHAVNDERPNRLTSSFQHTVGDPQRLETSFPANLTSYEPDVETPQFSPTLRYPWPDYNPANFTDSGASTTPTPPDIYGARQKAEPWFSPLRAVNDTITAENAMQEVVKKAEVFEPATYPERFEIMYERDEGTRSYSPNPGSEPTAPKPADHWSRTPVQLDVLVLNLCESVDVLPMNLANVALDDLDFYLELEYPLSVLYRLLRDLPYILRENGVAYLLLPRLKRGPTILAVLKEWIINQLEPMPNLRLSQDKPRWDVCSVGNEIGPDGEEVLCIWRSKG